MSEVEVLDKVGAVGYELGHVCGYSIATAIELIGGYVFFVSLKNANPIIRFGSTVLVATGVRHASSKGLRKLIDLLDKKKEEIENS